jgi:putative iron-only hydrogenase system regulator
MLETVNEQNQINDPGQTNQDRRFGFVGLIVDNTAHPGQKIQRILQDYEGLIRGRMGIPHLDGTNISVVTLIVQASSDELGALTGKLGRLEGVNVKSGLGKNPEN